MGKASDGIQIVPCELRFAVTRKCNGRCRHCYNESGKDTDRLSLTDITDLIREVHTLNPGFDRITLTGGEPMEEKEKILQISSYAHTLGIRVRLVTRGWELDPATCIELLLAGVSRVQIGLDSSGDIPFQDDQGREWDTLHSWLRDDEYGFRNSLEGIQNALHAGLEVSVRYSLCRSNLNDVVQTYQRISGMGATKFKFRVLFPDGRAKDTLINELISGKDLAHAQYNLIKASVANLTVVEITQPCLFRLPGRWTIPGERMPNAFREPCPCGTVAAYIDANGDVKYCLFDEESIGNVCQESFMNIWNSGQMSTVRKLRCPLDQSGSSCSSFRLLYSRFADYEAYSQQYTEEVMKIAPWFQV